MSPLSSTARVGIVHVHSDYSHDGCDSLEHLYTLCAERGIDFVGLTDHAEDFDASVFDRYRAECERLSDATVALIPGLEFRFAGFPGLHLLAFGLTHWIAPTDPGEFMELANEAASFTMWAHPCLCRYQIPQVVEDGVDAIEVWNAAYNTRYLPDPKAIALLHHIQRRRPDVVGVVGLDQHDARNDRETRIMVDSSESNPLDAIRRGFFTNLGRTMSFDSAVNLGKGRLGALRLTRLVYDRVERTQDWIGRRWSQGRR
jgi:hypothetical protein